MADHPVACEAWQTAVAGWVVAQLDPAEEAALLAHLDSCATCRAEAASLLDVAAEALGADLGPPADEVVAPPADLGERVLARIARERRARRAGRVATVMAGAAAAVAAVAVAGSVLSDDADAPLRGEDVVFARTAPGVDATAVLASVADGSLLELSASGLDPDVTYALWLTPPGGGYPDRVAAGTFRPDADGDVHVRLHSALPAGEMGRVWATTPQGDIALDTEPS